MDIPSVPINDKELNGTDALIEESVNTEAPLKIVTVPDVVEVKAAKVADAEAANVVESEAANVVESEAANEAESEGSKVVESDESKVVESDEPKGVDSNESKVVDSNESKVVDSNESKVVDSNESKVVVLDESKVVVTDESKVVESDESKVVESDDGSKVVESDVSKVVESEAAVDAKVVETPTTTENETAGNAEQKNEGAAGEESAESTDKNDDAAVNGLPELVYEKDQWSPLNPDGKKIYSRDFLIALSKCDIAKRKPEATGQIELVVADEAKLATRPAPRPRPVDSDNASGISASFAGKTNFAPSFAKPSPRTGSAPNRRSQHGKQTSRSEGRRDGRDGRDSRDGRDGRGNQGGKSNIIEINLSLHTDVKLNKAENAWKPMHARKERQIATTDATVNEEVFKKFRSILNKLTPQNFDKLIEQVYSLNVDTDEKLEGIINLVFEKAVDEPNFSEIYAFMCKDLERLKPPSEKPPVNNNGEEGISFRRLLIKRCQDEFEKDSIEKLNSEKIRAEIKDMVDLEKKNQILLTLREKERKERVRSVGNMRFIGELFKQKYIQGSIMIICITTLLNKIEEETMECLCKLLTTVGKDLEMGLKKNLSTYFTDMRKISEDKTNNLNSRIRFMIKDVIELRLNAWVPRQKLAAPKKIDDYQADAEADRYNRNAYSKHSNSMNTSNREDQMYMGRNAGSRSVNEESGWSSVTPRNRPSKQPYVVDPAKLKNMGSSVSEVSLTPPSSGMWGRGSQTGKKDVPTNIRSSSVIGNTRKTSTVTFNPYNALLDEEAPQSSKKRDMPPPMMPRPEIKMETKPVMQSLPPPVQPEPAKPSESKVLTVEKMVEDFLECSEDPYSYLLDNLQCGIPKTELPTAMKKIIQRCLSFKKTKQIQVIGKIMGVLVVRNVIPSEEFLDIFKSSLEEIKEQYSNDDIWDKLSRFIWAFSTQHELTFRHLYDACAPVVNAKKGYELLLALFLEKVEDSNEKHLVKRLWEASGKMALTDWMTPENAEEFNMMLDLNFLLPPPPVEVQPLSPESAGEVFLEYMRKRMPIEEFKKFVQEHIGDKVKEPWFIRALTEAVYKFTICPPEYPAPRFDVDTLKVYYPLLIHYIANEPALEMECLFAIQNLLTELEHPQGIAGQLFEHLWDNGEAVSIEAFLKWESDNTQPKGKGVLLKELTSFFTILKSNDDSSDEASQVEEDQ